MTLKLFNKKRSQSLIELVISVALTMFFLTAFVVNLAFVTNRFSEYQDKYYAYQVIKEQKKINDRNLAYTLANTKMVSMHSSNDRFELQGKHLNYTNFNYDPGDGILAFTNQEKKFFLNDDYIYYWSMDGIPLNMPYIVDDKGDSSRRGVVSCSGDSCINPIVNNESGALCVSNNCMFFNSNPTTAGTVDFPSMSDLNNKARAKTTWEAWVNTIDPTKDQVFMSRGDYNYFGINNSRPIIHLKIGTQEVSLTTISDTLLPNHWYHLVATYDGAKIRLYINGTIVATSTSYTGLMGYSDNLKFGYFKTGTLKSFLGYLDEVKIYGRALSDLEISNRYKGFRDQLGLVADWHLDDALNVATYSGASETGLDPRFITYSSPDNISMTIEKTRAENNSTLCKSGACGLFYRSYSSKGTFIDSGHNYVQLHNIPNISISANIKLSSINSGYQGIIGKDTNGNYSLGLYDNDVRVALKINGTRYTETYDANLVINKWYQIDLTFDGTSMKLYIDGVYKTSWTHAGSISNDTDWGNIYMAYSGTGNEYFDGYIDEVRIYNRALSLDEINNRYDGAFTYYQYYKPVCRTSNNGVISSECLNCNPINSTECSRSESGNNFEPLLAKSVYVVKYGKGINYNQSKSEQIIPVVNAFYQQEADSSVWGGGFTPYIGLSCGNFVFGTTGDSASSFLRYNAACGDPACGRSIVGGEVCDAENMTFKFANGCNTCNGFVGMPDWTCDVCEADGYFEKTNTNADGYFVSPTFNFPKKMGLVSFGWIGTGGPVKFQFDCLDDIADVEGTEVPEGNWIYKGPDPLNPKRCTATDYYIVNPNTSTSVSSCWETDNQTLYNCQFFRFKVKIDAGVTAKVNKVRLNFGQYPYTIIK